MIHPARRKRTAFVQQQAAADHRAVVLGPVRCREICVKAIRVRWGLCLRCGDNGIDEMTGQVCWCQGGPKPHA